MAAKLFLFSFMLLTAVALLAPHASFAAGSGIVTNIWAGTSNGGCNVKGPCSFCDAIVVVSNVIKFLWQISIALAVLMVIYGALRLMISGGSEEQVGKAKSIMLNAVTGLIVALAAWAIINTILSVLAGNPTWPWNQISCS